MSARRRLYSALAVLMAVVAAVILVGGIHTGTAPAVFPGEYWEHIAPERAGFVPDGLALFVEEVGGHGLVVRHGCVVTWWGRYAHPLDVASGCKPVYAHLVYAAINDGLIADLDEEVRRHVPALDVIRESSQDPDGGYITWRHLLQQAAGYGVAEAPGAAFNYSDYQAALLADTLVSNVYDSSYEHADTEILQTYLADPLAFQDRATLDHKYARTGRLSISPRDFARFGLLYLHRGEWRGRRSIPRNLAVQAVSAPLAHDLPRTDHVEAPMLENQRSLGGGANLVPHMGSYSYMWWVNRETRDKTRLFPCLPSDAFLALGHSGHDVLLVVPSLDLVACWIDAFPDRVHAMGFQGEGHAMVRKAMQKLVAAMATPDAQD